MGSPTKRVAAASIGSKRRFLFRQRFPQHHDRWEAIATEASRRHNDDVDLADPSTVEEIGAGLGDDIELIVDAKSFEDIWVKPGELTAKARDRVRSYLNAARDYREHLEGLSRSEVDEAYALERAQYDETRRKAAAAVDDVEFYNSPEADADFSHWLKAGVWHSDEVIPLSLGKDPRVVNRTSLRSPRSSTSPFRVEYKRREWLVERAIEAGQLSASMKPESFIEWADKAGFDLSALPRNEQKQQFAFPDDDDDISFTGKHKRKYNNSLRIMMALLTSSGIVKALSGIKFSADDNIAVRLSGEIKSNGSNLLSPQTVASRLNEAAQLLCDERPRNVKLPAPK